MDKLYRLRSEIQLKSFFWNVCENSPDIILFYLHLVKLNQCYHDYFDDPKDPKNQKSIRTHRYNVRYAYKTFEDYIHDVNFGLISVPTKKDIRREYAIGLTTIKQFVFNYKKICRLWDKTMWKLPFGTRNYEVICSHHHFKVNQLIDYIEPEDLKIIDNTNNIEDTKLPWTSFFPIIGYFEFIGVLREDFIAEFFVIATPILGVYGINSGRFPIIGALLLSMFVLLFFLFIFPYLICLIKKSDESFGIIESSGCLGLVAGALTLTLILYNYDFETKSGDYVDKATNGKVEQVNQMYAGPENNNEQIYVYITDKGKCYHSSPFCPSLSNSKNVSRVERDEVINSRRPCTKCH